MPSPFPGMDPFLEARNIWPDVHQSLITAMRDALAPQVAPGYFIRVEQRTYIAQVEGEERVARPDAAIIAASGERERSGGGTATAVAVSAQIVTLPQFERIREGYLEIRDARTHEVVTAIELLSPTNKTPGAGRTEYEEKRRQVLHSLTSLIEIDLLRGGEPMEMTPAPTTEYHILVSPGWERPRARLYGFGMRDVIPEVPVPLRQGEKEAQLALCTLLADLYDRARYDLSVEYGAPPPGPPFPAADAAWVQELLSGTKP